MKNPFQQYKVAQLLFGVDNVLVEPFTETMYPEAVKFLTWLAQQVDRPESIVLVSNQGGVGLRHWMQTEGWGQPGSFPTQAAADARLDAIGKQVLSLAGIEPLIICSYRYYSPRAGWSPLPPGIDEGQKPEWSQDWRMPRSGMFKALVQRTGICTKDSMLVWKNKEEDMAAARLDIRRVEQNVFFESYQKADWRQFWYADENEWVKNYDPTAHPHHDTAREDDYGLSEDEIPF